MNSIDLIRENLKRSDKIVLARIDDMRDHGFVFPTINGGCHTLWILGHLAFIEALVVEQIMLGKKNTLSHWEALFDGEEVIADQDAYPTFDETLDQCRQKRRETILILDSFVEDDLDQNAANCPASAKDLFGSYRMCLQYVSDHWFMHRGQLADARRAAGIQKMWY